MDLRNLSGTPNQLDSVMQRRPSFSSLSSTSGYASSSYGGASGNNSNANNNSSANNATNSGSGGNTTPQMANQRLSTTSRNNLNLQSSWLNQQSGPPGIPSANVGPWVEQQQQQQHSTLSSLDAKGGLDSSFQKEKSASLGPQQMPSSSSVNNDSSKDETITNNDDDLIDDDELIPTAIVIKNIPFAIKKEQLLDVMTKLNLPLPYAFNYHFDNGVFRGLAFANFTSTDETSMVVNHLNGREIGGRKLRVEYKKMLPLQERERIEREKREKRGQLEEQHRSNSNASLASLMSAASTTAATKNLSVNGATPSSTTERLFLQLPLNSSVLPTPPVELNFNDPEVLELYTQLVLYRDDVGKSIFELAVSPANLNISQRKVLSILCTFLNLLELFDNGLIIVRRKPGHVVQSLTQTGLGQQQGQPAHSSSMMNLNQLGQLSAAATPTHPELLRSHSQSALPPPRLRQQTSTPVQQQQHFPQYQQQQGQGPGHQIPQQQQGQIPQQQQPRPYSQGQQFNIYQQPQQQQQQQQPQAITNSNQQVVTPTMVSSSAAALLRSSNNRSYVDIRSTPPLGGTFNQQQQQHSGNQQSSVTNSPTPQHHHSHHHLGQHQQQHFFSNQQLPSTPQPSTPLNSTDINARFQPFGQHTHLTGSLTSLQHQNGSSSQLDEYNNGANADPLANKFNNMNLSGGAYELSNSGIWGPK
ncbi:uncharacterized protein RJT20DRAFT_132058 [Scheffersomyces xylosifermentans]|uniref:uncharacterized protein n=1 Tax=Scheffersomyces xylosifermentans TaxID=1304137 RepID=UPI00315D549F